jgi:hypothetical protein
LTGLTCNVGFESKTGVSYLAVADTADAKVKCCQAKTQGCKTYTCSAPWKADTTKTLIYTTSSDLKGQCCTCDLTQKTCCARAASGQTCAVTHLYDDTKAGNAVATGDTDFKTQCCTIRNQCATTWNDYTPPKSSSSAIRQAKAMATLLSLFAALAFGQ